MKTLPSGVQEYRRTPVFSEQTLPAGLRRSHATRSGVWGRIEIHQGRLLYRILGANPEEHVLTPDRPGVIEPEVVHEVEPIGPVRFRVAFLRAAPR